MKRTMSVFWGIVLVAAGALLILVQLDFIKNFDFRWVYIWPAFMIILGLMFHVQFFADGAKSPGILVPGGILLVYGCLFMFLAVSSWGNVGYLWPVFLVGPGFGLLELKLFSRGREGSWVPVIILFGLAVFFLIKESFADFRIAGAIGLIIVGVAIIVSAVLDRNKRGKKKETYDDMEMK